jgi:hypothetical protein
MHYSLARGVESRREKYEKQVMLGTAVLIVAILTVLFVAAAQTGSPSGRPYTPAYSSNTQSDTQPSSAPSPSSSSGGDSGAANVSNPIIASSTVPPFLSRQTSSGIMRVQPAIIGGRGAAATGVITPPETAPVVTPPPVVVTPEPVPEPTPAVTPEPVPDPLPTSPVDNAPSAPGALLCVSPQVDVGGVCVDP